MRVSQAHRIGEQPREATSEEESNRQEPRSRGRRDPDDPNQLIRGQTADGGERQAKRPLDLSPLNGSQPKVLSGQILRQRGKRPECVESQLPILPAHRLSQALHSQGAWEGRVSSWVGGGWNRIVELSKPPANMATTVTGQPEARASSTPQPRPSLCLGLQTAPLQQAPPACFPWPQTNNPTGQLCSEDILA